MVDSIPLPLYQRVTIRRTLWRTVELLILFLAVCFLVYRLIHLKAYGFPWLLAFFCELCFTFDWLLFVLLIWNPVDYKTYPQRLLQQVPELPPLDIFVTTADATIEPPLLVINTVLSLLAIDYPATKLACYVSDDGGSPFLLYSLVEASNFAKLWIPFCKKYNIQVRAPFRYFSSEFPSEGQHHSDFRQEQKRMKEEYEQLRKRIETAAEKSIYESSEYYAAFRNTDSKNHSAIIKVLIENREDDSNGIPNLVYVAREKRQNHPHQFKAGALNALARVSGVMTNAPFILNVDCDMFANNSMVALEAMCVLLGGREEGEGEEGDDPEYQSVFVHFPQIFYNLPKDDPFGCQLNTVYDTFLRGMAGIQGPLYGGSNCILRRKIIYTLNSSHNKGKFDENFGDSVELTKSANEILTSCGGGGGAVSLSGSIQAAYRVATCDYENNSSWGSKVGWLYGSISEDVLTGIRIHSKGWKSVLLFLDPPAFMGLAPMAGPDVLTQRKRWLTGCLQILFSKDSPFVALLSTRLQLRQCLAYTWFLSRSLLAIPVLSYAVLPAYSIIADSHFLPTVEDKAPFTLVLSIFIMYNLHSLCIHVRSGLSVRAWCNYTRVATVAMTTSYVFGVLSPVLKFFGISEAVFEVTPKHQSDPIDDVDQKNVGRFAFNESPMFVMGTTIVLVHLATLALALVGMGAPKTDGQQGSGTGEVLASLLVLLSFVAFLKGLYAKGKYGIPYPTVFKSAALTLLFVHLCKRV